MSQFKVNFQFYHIATVNLNDFDYPYMVKCKIPNNNTTLHDYFLKN